MASKSILILLGGKWHNFEGFATAVKSLLDGEGFLIDCSYDPNILTHLDEQDIDLLLSYTCLATSTAGEKPNTQDGFNTDQVRGLVQWVSNGGALLAVHASTVIGNSDPALVGVLGGAFLSHPPQSVFKVIPLSMQHPIIDGIKAFEVDDELYIERYQSSVTIHMVAIHEHVAHPIVWSKSEGRGRVAHIALGHSSETWRLKPYQRLMLQTIRWLINH